MASIVRPAALWRRKLVRRLAFHIFWFVLEPRLAASQACAAVRLIVAAVEVGGRISHEAAQLLCDLSSFRTRSEPEVLRASMA